MKIYGKTDNIINPDDLGRPKNCVTMKLIVGDPDDLLTQLYNDSDTNDSVGRIGRIKVPGVTIEMADPDSEQWDTLPEGKVILSDKETRIKVTMKPQIAFDPATCFSVLGNSLLVKTTGTAPSGVQIPISATITEYYMRDNAFEIRKTLNRADLKSLGLLPSQDNDNILEKAWMDTGSNDPTAESNLSDGLSFDTFNATLRGQSTDHGTLDDSIPNSPLHPSFFQAAGVELITVECYGVKSKPRQLMNQADIFYFSGHGYHITGGLSHGDTVLVQQYWKQDLDVVIFAGCSVLDINDLNNNFSDPTDHQASPGKLWEQTGPSILLGYNYYAPNDLQNSAQIVSSWIANRNAQGDVNAWMNANNNSNGRNACAIEKGIEYKFYKRSGFSPFYSYTLTIVDKANW